MEKNVKSFENISKSKKKIQKIYSEISQGLQEKSMNMEMVRLKLSEAGLLINEIEKVVDPKRTVASYYE
jgi:hypothetical protein